MEPMQRLKDIQLQQPEPSLPVQIFRFDAPEHKSLPNMFMFREKPLERAT